MKISLTEAKKRRSFAAIQDRLLLFAELEFERRLSGASTWLTAVRLVERIATELIVAEATAIIQSRLGLRWIQLLFIWCRCWVVVGRCSEPLVLAGCITLHFEWPNPTRFRFVN